MGQSEGWGKFRGQLCVLRSPTMPVRGDGMALVFAAGCGISAKGARSDGIMERSGHTEVTLPERPTGRPGDHMG